MVEPDRRMRVIGGQGVVMVEVDPKGLSYEDDVFAIRGVRLQLVPPQGWISANHEVDGTGQNKPGGLTIERLVSRLRREVKASGSMGRWPDPHPA